MTYRAPVAEMAFTLRHVAGLDRAIAEGLHGDLTDLELGGGPAQQGVAQQLRAQQVTGAAPLCSRGNRDGHPLLFIRVSRHLAHAPGQTLEGGDVLPGFSCRVTDLFA